MKKTELISKIAETAEISKVDATKAIEAFTKVIEEALVAGDEVSIPGLGKFEVRERAARKGINPATKEQIDIPATKVPAFKVSSALKKAVKE